ncbi:MFS transporter [Streptosporangium jomthongense]|uniref:MFS transporter n=1 Tax=Streptosporangium jomthongense TaxID=1193683 RepID=A0ABV8FEN3_9ACTN
MRARTSARLGADFGKLWTASAVSNVGDGVTLTAGPLLVASLSDDPVLVAGAVLAQQLPWVLFSLVSGAYVDRLDRRRLIVGVNLVRALALGTLCAVIAAGALTVPLVYVVFFLLGTAETVADTASAALLPAVVAPELLAGANTRLMATFTVGNQFAAKPLGGWLFTVSAALPFGFDALTFVVAAALVSAMRPLPLAAPPGPSGGLRADIAEGVRRLWRHRLLRTLALSMGVGNLMFCGAFAVFVLYARQRLGLSEVGYGLLLTAFAAGGLLGTLTAGRLWSRFGATALLRAGLLIEAATHLVLALTTRPWVAAAILVVFGTHAMVWGVIVVTLRQRAVPGGLLGRVTSAYALLDVSGAALGSLLGGVVAHALGITAPFWIAAGTMLVVLAVAWRPLGRADAQAPGPAVAG